MSSVETIKGALEVDRLGRTLMHEHVFILTPDCCRTTTTEWWDEEERVGTRSPNSPH